MPRLAELEDSAHWQEVLERIERGDAAERAAG